MSDEILNASAYDVWQELRTIKRGLRALRAVTTIAILSLALLLSFGMIQPKQKTAELQELRIVNAQGQLRASLSVTDNDTYLSFWDSKGLLRLSLAMVESDGSGSRLLLADGNGKLRATFGCAEEGPSLTLADKEQHVLTRLGLESDKYPKLNFYNSDDSEKPTLSVATLFNVPMIRLGRFGESGITMIGSYEGVDLDTGVAKPTEAQINISDTNDKTIWKAPP